MLDRDGWFPTGDVAKIDSDGYVILTDRSKDVIKSGGEWISSIDLENAAVAHPDVKEAAVIGLPTRAGRSGPSSLSSSTTARSWMQRPSSTSEASRREMVAAGRCRLRQRSAPHRDREAAEIEAARAVQGPRAADGRRLMGARFTSVARIRRASRGATGQRRPRNPLSWSGAVPQIRFDDPDGMLGMLRESVETLGSRHSGPASLRSKRAAGADSDPVLWQAMAEAGWTAIHLAEDLGGAGLGHAEQAVVSEALGRALICEPVATCAVFASILLNEAPCPRAEPARGRPDVGSPAVSPVWQDPLPSSRAIPLSASKTADGFILDGERHFVDGATSATDFLVAVDQEPARCCSPSPQRSPASRSRAAWASTERRSDACASPTVGCRSPRRSPYRVPRRSGRVGRAWGAPSPSPPSWRASPARPSR